jgi:hypothetical protein
MTVVMVFRENGNARKLKRTNFAEPAEIDSVLFKLSNLFRADRETMCTFYSNYSPVQSVVEIVR